ncbi:hypothetical protein AB0L85_18080 [Streptomyces sp. NPDC052051]|uniref:hypothetical protein n=1 Tax=Streptomyces sp. NPDC052051 TaxID=3154649 RepID=UPI003447FBE3
MTYTANRAVLRRRSWPVFFGILILGMSVGMSLAVYKVTSVNGFRSGWQGIPIYLALAGVAGRVANCKVVLCDDVLLVVNPLRTHIVPKMLIHGASVADDGTLEVDLDEGRNISAFAFGGSLIDRFKDTSGEARQKISSWLHSDSEESGTGITHQSQWTRCAPADLCLILCAVTAGAGAIWMALSGS